MAVVNHKNNTQEFVGAVFGKFEHNGYHDSDFYVQVWDDAARSPKVFCYDSTCHAGSGISVKIDATQETLEKLVEWAKPLVAKYRHDEAVHKANTIEKGCLVRVYKGRKVAKGTEGKVFWLDKRKGFAYGTTETILGIALDEVKENGKYKNVVFVNADHCVRLDAPSVPSYEEIFSSLDVDTSNVQRLLYGIYGYRLPQVAEVA